MVKATKFLTYLAIALFVVIVALAFYTAWQTYRQGDISNQATVDRQIKPREEVKKEYFSEIKLDKETYKLGETPVLLWATQKDGSEFIIKVVDATNDIFISTSAATEVGQTAGSQFSLPTTVGNYEAWLYLILDDQETLVATLPFTVTQ